MMPIKDLLNKIKWDERETESEYEIGYFDRIANKLIFVDLMEVEVRDGVLIDWIDDREVTIPFHRIKEVKKKGVVVWKREH